jgi:hypothetical protein
MKGSLEAGKGNKNSASSEIQKDFAFGPLLNEEGKFIEVF